MTGSRIRVWILSGFAAAALWAQQPATGPKPEAPKPAPAAEAPKPAAPAPVPPPAATQTAAPQRPGFQLNLTNAPLTDLIDHLARILKINYVLDPRVKPGTVTINTYGEIKDVDARALLETVLRINGNAMVQVGEMWRIVPATDVAKLPVSPQMETKNFPDDERVMLNLVFLKYALVGEMAKLLQPFMGEGAQVISYDPANLLLILDNSRNMRRTMELIAMFDSDSMAAKRVRLFETKNGRPSDLARDIDTIMRSVSLSGDRAGAVRFVPVDRLNTIIAVAPNPGVFDQVEVWLKKLDIPVKVTAGSVDNYVYRVKYGRAEMLAMAIMQLYLGSYGFGGYGMYGGGMYGGGMYGGGMYGGGMYGGGMSGGGFNGGMYPGSYGGGMYPGGYGGGMSPYGGGYPGGYGMMPPQMAYGGGYGAPVAPVTPVGGSTNTAAGTSSTQQSSTNQTGTYLSQSGGGGYGYYPNIPHITPNPMDNSLLIQGTPQEYAQIEKLLTQLDIPPRQVLIEAKIYEVVLTGAFSSGVQAYLNQRGAQPPGAIRTGSGRYEIEAASTQTDRFAGLQLNVGMLVGQSRQLLAILRAQEDNRRTRIISAPNLIATDSVQASINVGTEVPTLTGQAVSPVQSGGTSLFTQSISNRSSGVTLSVLARVNPSGIVTLQIQQQVSAPVAPAANSAIQSPSFSNRTVQTQVTVQDGDTIAIGGIIQESDTKSSAGIPGLHRIPILGSAFGAKSSTKERTELVVFMTPRVIYDTNQVTEATEELKSKYRKIRFVED